MEICILTSTGSCQARRIFIFFRNTAELTAQSRKTNQVRNGHQAVGHFREPPHRPGVQHSPQHHRQRLGSDKPALAPLSPEESGKPGSVIAPAKNRGRSKENQSRREKNPRPAAKDHKLTVKELNELACRLYNEYGLETQPGAKEIYSWVEIPHTYENPFYYISYATSAVNALDILSLSQEDYREAVDTYMRLTALPMDIPYQQALEQVGLHNTFDADTLQFIGQGVAEYVNDLSGFIDYADAA